MSLRTLAVTSLAVATLGLGACSGGGAALTAADAPYTLTILHINDHHSHLDAEERAELLLDTGDGRREVYVDAGGFPRVVSAINRLAQGRDNVLKLHAGDALTGTLYFTQTDGAADAVLMNTVCFDAMAVGNHEFDTGDAGLKKFIDFLHAGPCQTPVLSSNVQPGPASPLGQDAVRPYTVVSRGGVRIGIVGVTVAGKTMKSSRPDPGTRLGNEAVAAQAAIDALRADGVRHIVLLSHMGHVPERLLATQLSGVDVVVGGDSHTLLGPASLKTYGLNPAGPYPVVTADRDGHPVCVVQAWQYAQVVGELQVQFDPEGNVTQCGGTPHVLLGEHFMIGDQPVEGAARTAILQDLARAPALEVTPPDATAEAALAPWHARLEAFAGQRVATVSQNLCLRRIPGPRRDPNRSTLAGCNQDPHVIAHGGDVQQLVTQAFLVQGQTYGGADIALQNGGGTRVDLSAGPLTVAGVYDVLPFKNKFVRLTMSGGEIRTALEGAMEAVVKGGSQGSGGYPYAAGLRWNVDLGQPAGQRLSALEVRNARGEWQPLDAAATYRVITTDYLASGRDGFSALAAISGDRLEVLELAYAEAFLKYVEQHPELSRLPESEYSTQRFVDTR